VALRQLRRRGRQIDRGDAHPALQELQAVEAHAAADLEQVLPLEQRRLALDAVHDPGELVRVHPGADVLEELGRPDLDARIRDVLQPERVGIPVAAHRRDGLFDRAFQGP
jgi:hypothetical protein